MFKFDLDKSVESKSIKGDYFYAIYQVNEYLYDVLSKQVMEVDVHLENVDYFKCEVLNQTVLFFKDNFLSFLLVHEYEIAKLSNVLSGKNQKEQFKNFIILTSTKDWLEYFFEKYPLIQNRIENFINNFVCYFDFFISRLKKDFLTFGSEFDNVDKITDIKLFLGDFHQGNKYVLRIDFLKSNSLFFKPRSFDNELFFNKILSYYKTLDPNLNFIIPKSISREDYCWVNELQPTNCFENNDQINEFYYNQGKLLFLFHLLGSEDIIPDNLIISENRCGYFDLECLISKPKLLLKESLKYIFQESVIKVGMLPDWMIGNNFEKNILSSTFFELNSQLIGSKIWKRNGADFNYVDSAELFSKEEDKHLPKVNNRVVELTEDSLKRVIDGFRDIYNLSKTQKENIKLFFLEKCIFQDFKFRAILHPTSLYSMLYREINLPEYLKDASEIDYFIESLVDLSKTDNYVIEEKVLIESIKKQIFQLDIPYFWFKAGGDLHDGNDTVVCDEWKFDPLIAVIEKLENLSDIDLKFQTEIIRKSCKFVLELKDVRLKEEKFIKSIYGHYSIKNDKADKIEIVRSKLINSAIKIGEALNDSFYEVNSKINWISKVRDPVDGKYHISLLNYDLYDGQSGVALFYLYLYKYTKDITYRDNALKIFNQLNETAVSMIQSGYYSNLSEEFLRNLPISPYSFPMSFVYLQTHFNDVLGSEYVDWETINLVLDQIMVIIPKLKNSDYLLGFAGIVDFLLNMKKESICKEIDQKIDHIILFSLEIIKKEAIISSDYAAWKFNNLENSEENKLGGFSHGTAGISYVLFKASVLTKNEELKRLGKLALDFDRNFYDEEVGGWLDRRDLGEIFDSCSWCHGSGGIGLGRILTRQFYSDDFLENEILIAKNNIFKNGLLGNQCVCHGDFGNLEILKALDNEGSDHYVWGYLEKLCDKFTEKGRFECGDGGQMDLLGLFMGYSGFGYQMLRFYDWEKCPSILCLETPNSLNYELHKK
ncbi:type 2 lanthipeptide synthetase LanM [Flavobacterium sp.]|uniref:type 2 lanthipeptide synthetase LanM n=1 Tax=Flavobacterium sp. TaxID=239 RepID=UPI0025BB0E43|nr:type 2 lanthipeptide synthetase LanM [Flavobacterium sp.]